MDEFPLLPSNSPLSYSLLNLNILGEPRGDSANLEKRLKVITNSITNPLHDQPDILCFQEAFLPYTRDALSSGLSNDYTLHFARQHNPIPPLASFLPCVLLATLFYLIFPTPPRSTTLAVLMTTSPLFLFVLIRVAFAFNVLNLPYSKPVSLLAKSRLDFMGTVIAFKKSSIKSSTLLHTEGFSHSLRGYPLPPLNPSSLLIYFIQHTFFRPGFLISSCTLPSSRKVLVCNVHLVLGYPNPSRRLQVKRVLDVIRSLQDDCCYDSVVISGDFNAPTCDEAFRILEDEGWVDMSLKHGKKQPTWVKKNELCEFEADEFGLNRGSSERIDFCFVKNAGSDVNGRCWNVFDGIEGEICSDHYGLRVEVNGTETKSPKSVIDHITDLT
ncbi:hypothetical protein TrST_g4631 [Triparma strigata]|uniref:Endonuclease/exonuclease/phosphatase domain-containing protein n=1 Tax=Triparma strigata TaxID=1606541 RepID=A0A9W7F036_9STRA|nr:hypothetical protein TrST_g4631 [Triparma strigata]